MKTETDGSRLTREVILNAFGALSEQLADNGIMGEICLFDGRGVYGGSSPSDGKVMLLAFNARFSKGDVDTIFQPAQLIRKMARQVAEELCLSENWISDGVKSFVSKEQVIMSDGLTQFPHLRLTIPVLEYLLAMKCMAARVGGTTRNKSDRNDIVVLIRHLAFTNITQIFSLLGDYYPANQIPVKTQNLVEGLFDESCSIIHSKPFSRKGVILPSRDDLRVLRESDGVRCANGDKFIALSEGKNMKPVSLAEVARQTAEGDYFNRCLGSFLDEFYAHPCRDAFLEKPISLQPKFGNLGLVYDSYLAATADQLAISHHLPGSDWAADEKRRLHRPWFASPLASLRAVLLLESPATFRSRNLFVSENTLSRA